MLQPLAFLKNLFRFGRELTEVDFHDLLDSFVHKTDQAAINNAAINNRLGLYHDEQNALSTGANVLSVGDMKAAFTGFPKSWNLKQKIDQVSGGPTAPAWADVTGKPTRVALRWTEQIVTTDFAVVQTQGIYNGFARGWLAEQAGATAGSQFMVADVHVERRVTPTGNTTYTTSDGITKLKLAVNPFIQIS